MHISKDYFLLYLSCVTTLVSCAWHVSLICLCRPWRGGFCWFWGQWVCNGEPVPTQGCSRRGVGGKFLTWIIQPYWVKKVQSYYTVYIFVLFCFSELFIFFVLCLSNHTHTTLTVWPVKKVSENKILFDAKICSYYDFSPFGVNNSCMLWVLNCLI